MLLSDDGPVKDTFTNDLLPDERSGDGDDVMDDAQHTGTMRTHEHLATLPAADANARASSLREAGVRILRGTFMDAAGILRAKQAQIERAAVFHSPGLGASPVWLIFCADDGIAFTPNFGVIGDMRLRADLDAAVSLGDGSAWAPTELADQDGQPLAFCPRGALRRQQAAAEVEGLETLAATEIEFVAFDANMEGIAGRGGPAYGLAPLLEHAAFVDDVHRDFDHAGLSIEQLHAEYGSGQIEISVAPAPPLHAADSNVLARILLCRAGRRHGLRLSFSPRPLPSGVGNGAHVHLSFRRDTVPLLSGGRGPYGLTDSGAAIVGGLVQWLPDVIGALAPSMLSGSRLQPGHWAGAFACWGLENREAAVRLCAGTAGNPRGAHVEVKCVDPSANPYVVNAVLVGLARRALANCSPLPAETTSNPSTMPDEELAQARIVRLESNQSAMLDTLERSKVAQEILGAALLEALVAVRRHEADVARGLSMEELVQRFRFTWSV
jgi:glutamine synthetase